MRASRLAAGAVALALGAAGCSSNDSTYTAVEQATTAAPTAQATTPTDTTTAPTSDSLAGLPARDQKALAPLAGAQAALEQRGNAVADAETAADKVVQRINAGYNAPPGPKTPAVRRLAEALDAFGSTLGPIATDPSLLPQLSATLRRRYTRAAKSHPAAAARLLSAKQQVDAVVEALPGLQQALRTETAKARAQADAAKIDATTLDSVIRTGSESATTALNGVNQAIDAGVRALAAAS